MQNFLAILLICILLPCFAGKTTPTLVMDGSPDALYPPRYRIIKEPSLHLLGSGQFTEAQLLHIRKTVRGPLILIDLRQESHGFVNGLPVSWYSSKNWENKDRSGSSISALEHALIAQMQDAPVNVHQIIAKNRAGQITKSQVVPLYAKVVLTEEELAKRLNIPYYRFYVTDHGTPNQNAIAQLQQLAATLPANTWVYFHCRGGVGRTSTFMVLYEIFRKQPKQPLANILKRQVAIGGKDLSQLPPSRSYKYFLHKQRFDLIQKYYLAFARGKKNPLTK